MILKDKDLYFISSVEDDPIIRQFHDDQLAADNLSEIHQHPWPLPEKLIFRIEHNKENIGYAMLRSIRWFNRKAEITLVLEESHRGKGYGVKTLNAITRYVFNTLNFHRLEAEIFAYNKNAIKSIEGFGFKKEGILREARFFEGKYYDIIRYGLLRREWQEISE